VLSDGRMTMLNGPCVPVEQ
ncbi:hypothetical protein A2U01_0005835, partial [Trifolium medium]|nr:hypothetical protein [Trifolium medium]